MIGQGRRSFGKSQYRYMLALSSLTRARNVVPVVRAVQRLMLFSMKTNMLIAEPHTSPQLAPLPSPSLDEGFRASVQHS